ncbi:DUF1697 domain-containing protein [Aestuariivivens marinum]
MRAYIVLLLEINVIGQKKVSMLNLESVCQSLDFKRYRLISK